MHRSVRQHINDLAHNRIPFLFCIDFEMEKPFVIPLDEINPDLILYSFNGISNDQHIEHTEVEIKIEKQPVSFDIYQQAFQKVMKEIRYGNSYLLNLTFRTEVRLNVSLKEVYLQAKALYKMWKNDEFIFFSPETFVLIREGKIYAHPMKGTIDAAIPDAEKLLLENHKELAEHHTIVDLIRNDIAIHAKNVKVEKFRYLSLIKTNEKNLIQMSSEISGELDKDYRSKLGDILFSLLPAGSVSGAPKHKTVNIIKKAEKIKRGWYTGVCGIFDGHNLDSCVMIRFIEQQNNRFFYRSGGGITVNSSVEQEYRELIDKIYVPIA